MNEQKYLATTKNGHKVFVDLVKSHAATHLADNGELMSLVEELVSQSDIQGENVVFEKDMGRTIGNMDLVETDDTDEIIYAKRTNRDIYTRFVKNRKPVPTQYLTVILKEIDDGYELWSAWVGRLVPSFPGDDNEKPESKAFWSSHALIWGNQAIQESTVTATQPW